MDWDESFSAAEAAEAKARELKGPLMTDDEMEKQYSMVYRRAQAGAGKQGGANAVRAGFGCMDAPG